MGDQIKKVHFTYWLTLFLMYFYSTPFWGRVYKWKLCLYVHLFVCLSSLLILFLFQTKSLRNILQSTLITQPLPRYLISPIHVSHARESREMGIPAHPCTQATSPTVSNVPHPCLPCPPVNWSPFPVNWSPNEQDHITDLSLPLGVELCVNLTFFFFR